MPLKLKTDELDISLLALAKSHLGKYMWEKASADVKGKFNTFSEFSRVERRKEHYNPILQNKLRALDPQGSRVRLDWAPDSPVRILYTKRDFIAAYGYHDANAEKRLHMGTAWISCLEFLLYLLHKLPAEIALTKDELTQTVLEGTGLHNFLIDFPHKSQALIPGYIIIWFCDPSYKDWSHIGIVSEDGYTISLEDSDNSTENSSVFEMKVRDRIIMHGSSYFYLTVSVETFIHRLRSHLKSTSMKLHKSFKDRLCGFSLSDIFNG